MKNKDVAVMYGVTIVILVILCIVLLTSGCAGTTHRIDTMTGYAIKDGIPF